MIFDGLLTVHSTCAACGEAMTVINADEKCHPCCDVEPTELEQLSTQLLDAITRGHDDTANQIAARMDRLEQVIDLPGWAETYASWGWPVFPLTRNGKQPAIPKAKGGKGFKDATTDRERITKWWKRHPDHNIGLATGHMFDVIDVDTKDSDGNPSPDGIVSFSKLLETKDLPECYGLAVTGSGGMHLYVKPTGKGNFAAIRPGIDYRGLGGYVVAPPSTLGVRWRSYTWLTEPGPEIKR